MRLGRRVRQAADRPARRDVGGANGYVYINGKKLDEPYVKPDRRDPDTHGPAAIPRVSTS